MTHQYAVRYLLPGDPREQVDLLAERMNIRNRIHLQQLPPEVAAELLTLILLNRHIEPAEKRRLEQLLERVDRRVLNDLQTAMAVPAVQPGWALWSLTNNEVKERKVFLSRLTTAAGAAGLTLSVDSIKDFKQVGKLAATSPTAAAAIVATIVATLAQIEESQVDQEILRRLP